MTVLKIFKKHEFEAFIVGGAVRDYLLKMPYSDIDITTNAKPEEVMKFFKSAPTGLKYGTVTIFFNDFEYEVTTYRSEEHTSELQSRPHLVCRLLLEKKNKIIKNLQIQK